MSTVSKLVSLFSPSSPPSTTEGQRTNGTTNNGHQTVIDTSQQQQFTSSTMTTPANTRNFLPIFISAQVVGLLAIILVISWTTSYLGGLSWSVPATKFNWHPLLMVIAFVYLYGNSILIYRILRDEPKPKLKLIHAGINGLAFVLALIAQVAVFTFHNDLNIPNLYSLHSWVGLGVMILFGSQLAGGAVLYLYPKTPANIRAMSMPLHVYGGVAMFGLAVVACLTGITEKALFKLQPGGYGKLPSEAYVLNFLGIAIVVFALLVGYMVTLPDYKRRPLPEETQLSMSMSSTRETINN